MSGAAHPGAAAATRALVPDVQTLQERLAGADYLADEGLATALFFAVRLPQPLLLEGEAGVGKTEAAKALAAVLGTPLIRLQCYEGIDSAEVLYEWNYPRQLLAIRLAEAAGRELAEGSLFADEYLIRRPLLAAIEHPGPLPAVLLIDELDRADADFEAFLLELLAEATLTIPEIGTVVATHPPVVVLTSNRTRDLHDALKRRCLYHWIEYPSAEREAEIVRRRVPGAAPRLAGDVAAAVRRLRSADVQKPPGIAEAIDWVAALELLGARQLDAAAAERTLGAVLKYREDQERRARAASSGLRPPMAELDLAALAVAFGRELRGAGIPTTPDRTLRFARALALAPPAGRDALYWTARAVFVSAREQIALFDAVFGRTFDGLVDVACARGDANAAVIETGARASPRPPSPDARSLPAPDAAAGSAPGAAMREQDPGEGPEREVSVAAASELERLADRDFAELDGAELAAVRRMMAELALATPTRLSRRSRRDRHGERLDLRATLRASRRTGGDPARQLRRRRRRVPRRLVVLCDISGSMEAYSRVFLQFLHSATAGADAEAFAFATRLTRLTRALRGRSPDLALARAAAAAPDWSGGTRIGEALRDFNDRYGRRGMAHGSVVVILSDGWERGDPALLAREMERLRRFAHRIVWVNPRKAAPDFAPLAGGMAAALPSCDAFLAGNSLRGLAAVADAITGAR